MSFIYDDKGAPAPNPETPATKVDLRPLPPGADPTKYVTAADWNTVNQMHVDTRDAIVRGLFHGLQVLTAPPATPPTGQILFFALTNGLPSPDTVVSLCILWPNGTYSVWFESDPH